MTLSDHPAVLDGLRDAVRGPVRLLGDPDLDDVRRPWNLTVDQDVAAVVHAADAADVARYVAPSGIGICPRPIGHGAAGSATGTVVGGSGDLVGTWQSVAFRDEALGWVREVLARQGITVAGPLVPHRVRFWSAVLTVRTDRGAFWFKATNPGQAFEGPVLALLGRLVPDDVVGPVAVDADRGWILLPDGGPSVGRGADVSVAEWEGIVVQVARMQQALAGHGAELARAGLPSLLPEHAHGYVTELLESLARLPATHPQHVDAEECHALLRGLRDVGTLVAELADSGVPPTLQPNDTSTANAVRAPSGRGYRFFDLGDAFWSHPFAVLQVPLRMASDSWPHAPAATDPVRARLVSAYLEQWAGTADDGLVDAADRLASIHRCESWRRLTAPVDGLGATAPRLADWVADAVRPLPGRTGRRHPHPGARGGAQRRRRGLDGRTGP